MGREGPCHSVVVELQDALGTVVDGHVMVQRIVDVLDHSCEGIVRLRLGIETGHPSLMAIAWVFQRGTEVAETRVLRDVTQTATYLRSPVREVKERRASEVRIHIAAGDRPDYNLTADLVAEGLTDYLALPLPSKRTRDDVLTFATAKEGGFTEGDLNVLRQVPRALALPVALLGQRILNRTVTGGDTGVESDQGQGLLAPFQLNSPFDPASGLDRGILEGLARRFQALNILATPVWAFHPTRYQVIWANAAALRLWRADDLESMWRRDFSSSMSEAMAYNIDQTVSRLLVEDSFMEWAVLEPLGQPKRYCLIHHLFTLVDDTSVVMTEALREPPAEQIIHLAANLALTLVLFDDRGQMVSCNSSFMRLMGERVLNLGDLLREDWDVAYFIDTLMGLNAYSVEVPLDCNKGKRWFRVELRKVESIHRRDRVLASFFDITEQRLEEQELRRLARTDVLTDISNRHGVMSDAAGWLEQDKLRTLIFLDLDGLKMVNEVHGHGFGDRILQAAALRLRTAVGDKALIGRMGGDEFLVVFSETAEEEAERLREVLAQPFDIEEVHLTVTASFGTVRYPEDGETLEDLISRADMATLDSKRSGKNRVTAFGPSMIAQTERYRQLNRYIRRALAGNELRLVIQPIVDLATGMTVRGECLMRWDSAELGSISPGEFIPAAEEAGIISDLGHYAADHACEIMCEVHRLTGQWIPLSVNVSARELIDPNFAPHLTKTRDRWGIPRDNLILEMTETSLIDRLDRAAETLSSLQEAGFAVALDDFGTGYSSLSYLHRLSFDAIKLDRSLTMDLPGARSSAIVRAVVALAAGLEATVIGEGIETEQQGAALLELGCRYGQGYYFSRPLELVDWLQHARQLHAHRDDWRSAIPRGSVEPCRSTGSE